MSFLKTGFSAIVKLGVVIVLLASFLGAMAGVVYMSLSGEEIIVPEITGKDFFESEKELAALGLKIKRRADRPSTEKMNTVLEQLPKPGETVKTGQLIFVVVSKAGIEGEEPQKSYIKDLETDDSEKIEEMISEKPKKPKSNSNSNAKKKAETTRDVESDEPAANTDAGTKADPKSTEPEKKDPSGEPAQTDKGNRNSSVPAPPKTQPSPQKQPPASTRNRTQPRK
ncbi:MAG: PASTA domain-containing protein [Pyrinomonadaceae bacterium]